MDANLPTRRLLVALILLPMLAGCAASTVGGTAPPAGSSVTAAPSVQAASALPSPSGAPVTLIKGSATCEVTSYTDKTVGANLVMVEHFRCQNVMNDERVNGTMDADFTTTVEPATSPAMHWEGALRLANAGGTWRGQGRGAVVMWPDLNGAPMNYGVDTYVGEGGYAGLTYHEFVAGGDASADITGWIEPTNP